MIAHRTLSASFVIAICLTAPAAIAAPPDQYAVTQTVKTEQGQLQILEDARIDRAMEKDLWEQCVDPTYVYYGDPRARPFENNPPAPAKLLQLNEKGAIVLEEVLDENAPIARIDPEQLGPATHPVFQIETDNNVCMGSYSGRAVELFQFAGGRIAPVVLNDEAGKPSPLFLTKTLKSSWRFVRANPPEIFIEQVRSDPDDEHEEKGKDLPFKISYITIHFDGAQWTRKVRTEPGFWDLEHEFPSGNHFPQ